MHPVHAEITRILLQSDCRSGDIPIEPFCGQIPLLDITALLVKYLPQVGAGLRRSPTGLGIGAWRGSLGAKWARLPLPPWSSQHPCSMPPEGSSARPSLSRLRGLPDTQPWQSAP